MQVDFQSHVPDVKSRVKDAVRTALDRMGEKVVELAQDRTPVDTGNLRASITHQADGDDTELVGTSNAAAPFKPVEYAPYVELGTRKMHAQPFLVPAITENTDILQRIIEDALRGAT